MRTQAHLRFVILKLGRGTLANAEPSERGMRNADFVLFCGRHQTELRDYFETSASRIPHSAFRVPHL